MTSNIVENYSKVARDYYQEGKLGPALEACKKAIELKQNLETAYQLMGNILRERGNKETAADTFAKLGELFVSQGKFQRGAGAYRRATKLKPNSPIYHRDLGNALTHNHVYWYNRELKQLLIDEGCLDEAITCYQKAIELGLNTFWINLYLGDALTARERLEEAASAYQTALRYKIQQSYPDFVERYWDSAQINGPDFVIIGAAKCGTTSLYEYMIEHPQLVQTVKKEIDFFLNFDRGLNWYLSHFPPTPKGKVNFLSGEASTSYFNHHETRTHLLEQFPNAKLIAILRNPVDRAISHYHNDRKYSGETRSLHDAMYDELKALPDLSNGLKGGRKYWQSQRGYLWLGLYVYFIEEWMNTFPREQFLILQSEDFYAEPANTMQQVFEFLELPDYQLTEYRKYNKGSYSPTEESLRQELSAFFKPHNQKLEKYLGRSFNWDE